MTEIVIYSPIAYCDFCLLSPVIRPAFITFKNINRSRLGTNIIVTINSKEPFAEPDDMKFWWRIFYAAKESWTVSSTNWEGVNWGLFSGDDGNMKIQVERVLENARRLKANTILYPE